MIINLTVQFEVEAEDGSELDQNAAWSAADCARYDYLTFVKEVTQGRAVDEVTVHVDGVGPCRVKLCEP